MNTPALKYHHLGIPTDIAREGGAFQPWDKNSSLPATEGDGMERAA